MAEQTVNAASNPALVNQLVEKAMAEVDDKPSEIKIKPPLDILVDLPAGYIQPDGEVLRTAEVRELNGLDEEMIARQSSVGKALLTILSRGTVKLGSVPVTDEMLDKVLSADRDAIMLGIYRATFGNEAEIGSFCQGCQDVKTVSVDTSTDIVSKILLNPIDDRVFTVSGKSEYKVTLPTGKAQRELASTANDKNMAELDTLLLEYCVLEINGRPVLGKQHVLSIGITDRKKILTEIIKRNPGPKFEDVKVACPDCGGEVVVPISLGALFQF